MKQIFKKCSNCDGRGYVYQTNVSPYTTDGTPCCILCLDCNGRGIIPTAFYVEDLPDLGTTAAAPIYL